MTDEALDAFRISPTEVQGELPMSTPHEPQQTALVIDDDTSILEMLNDLLVDAGFATTTVTRGQDALDAIARQHFDVLLVDIGLPDMSGMNVCNAARSSYGPKAAILMITADARRERIVTALELGADDFVPKPFFIDELLARIHAKLRRRDGSLPENS
jgi:DNA-binding response OmpR family regulator